MHAAHGGGWGSTSASVVPVHDPLLHFMAEGAIIGGAQQIYLCAGK